MKMEIKNKIKWGLCAVAAALAVMGLCFAWRCPLDCVYGVDSGIFLFKRQLLWNVLGVAACVGAAFVPWRRWLKLAPWGMVAWLALSVAAMFSPMRHVSHRWADFGIVCINVDLVLVFAWALFSAWLCSKRYIRPWMIFAFIGGLLIAWFYLYVLGNANRLSRLVAFFRPEDTNSMYAYMQMQMKAAYAAAHWFGDADQSLRYLPVAYADAMPSAAALLFGKWFTLAVAALFATFGALLTWCWLAIKDPSKRMFILFWGGSMVAAAMFSFFQSVGFVPVTRFTPALAGCGGTLAVVFWTGLGVVLSMLSGEDESADMPQSASIAATVGLWMAVFAVFSGGVVLASCLNRTFRVPRPAKSAFGENGMDAKRGEIFAADGTVLARSVKSWNIYVDPVIATKGKVAFDFCAVSNVCSRLGLTPAELLDFCTNGKSRYVRVKSDVSADVAGWFESKEGRRIAKGFIVDTYYKREYPLGDAAAHVTGCVSRQGRDETGCAGVEYAGNGFLSGKEGVALRNAGRKETLAAGKPVHGGSVTTTVVPSIQTGLSAILKKTVADYKAESAWAVVLDVSDGGIVAMDSFPSYDPAGLRPAKQGTDYFRNNAAMANFEPGGLMRPFAYALAIDKGLVSADTEIDLGNGTWMYAGRSIKDVSGVTGTVTLAEAFVKLSNIGVAKVSCMLWENSDLDDLAKFGFGRKISRKTVYGEEKGIVISRKRIPSVGIPRLGLGNGICATGLQIANAYATLANGGKPLQPHLIAKSVGMNGVESVFVPETDATNAVSAKTAKTIASLMAECMSNVAKVNKIDFGGVEVAGNFAKVFVSEKGRYSPSVFNLFAAGFFPAETPKFVVAIGVHKPDFGSQPSPAARRSNLLKPFAEIVRTANR